MFQLFNADCLEKMKDISSNSIDLILCDLPFGCLTGGGGQEKTKRRFVGGKDTGTTITQKEGTIAGCSWDIPLDLEAFWSEVKRIRKNEHTPTLHFTTTKYGFELYNSNPKEFRYDLVWDKGRGVSFLSANKMPMRSHEMIYVFSKAGSYYNRVDVSGDFPEGSGGAVKKSSVYGKSETYGEANGFLEKAGSRTKSAAGRRCVKSVIPIKPNLGVSGKHPTEKPIDLYKFLIERYCPPNGTVLDPTFGSCNSGKAARELKRNYIGIEKNKDFFEKAKKSLLE
jgi:site-specific DNA-methyltransferase (adenine-specific)